MIKSLKISLSILIILLINGLASNAGANEPPTIESFGADQSGPLKTGSIVTWTAMAKDPEGDAIMYRFLLQGPRTNGKEEVVKDWSKSRIWTCEAKEDDIGSSDVIVQVRDASHVDAAKTGGIKTARFEISGKQKAFLNVQITNDVYSSKDPRIYFCDDNGRLSILNRIYLKGPDLNQVSNVKYKLDPSFQNNEIVSADASNNFEIQIMSWGRFYMSANVTTKDGQKFDIPYAFQFKSKVQEAQSRGIPMIRRCG